MNLNAQIIEESGKPKYAVLPIADYQLLLDELSDFDSIEDLADYLKAIKIQSQTKVWHTLDTAKSELGL